MIPNTKDSSKEKKGYADRQRRICNIESGPVVCPDMYVEKIYDMAVEQPVEQIPGRAAEQKCICGPVTQVLDHKDRKDNYCNHVDNDEKRAAESLKHPEGRARIFNMNDIKKGQNIDGIKGANMHFNVILGRLIEGQHNQGQTEKKERRFFHLRAP
jgi:hypothetical protein